MKWFCFPTKDMRDLAHIHVANALKELDISRYSVEAPATVEMSWDAFAALSNALATVALPMDRYLQWLDYGEDIDSLSQSDFFLSCFGFSRTRREHILGALFALEPYPSRKPIEGCRVRWVLENAGVVPMEVDWIAHAGKVGLAI